jgi:hypothetical protein
MSIFFTPFVRFILHTLDTSIEIKYSFLYDIPQNATVHPLTPDTYKV